MMPREIENALLLLIKKNLSQNLSLSQDLILGDTTYRVSEIYHESYQTHDVLEVVAYNLHKEHDPEDEDRVDLVVRVEG
jgi:hypothetical protein